MSSADVLRFVGRVDVDLESEPCQLHVLTLRHLSGIGRGWSTDRLLDVVLAVAAKCVADNVKSLTKVRHPAACVTFKASKCGATKDVSYWTFYFSEETWHERLLESSHLIVLNACLRQYLFVEFVT